MSKVFLASILVLIVGVAHAAGLCSGKISLQDGRPWPWGSETSMPWKNLSGVWKVSDGSCENLFLFKVGISADGEKIVSITQYDPSSCKVVASGMGLEADKYIYAQMAHHGKSYNLTIHAFNESALNDPNKFSKRSLRVDTATDPDKVVMAMTLSPVGEWDEHSAFQITKLKNSDSLVCDQQ